MCWTTKINKNKIVGKTKYLTWILILEIIYLTSLLIYKSLMFNSIARINSFANFKHHKFKDQFIRIIKNVVSTF